MPPVEWLQLIFAYEAETGTITYKADRGRAKAGQVAGSKTRNGYRVVRVLYKDKRYYILEHRLGWALAHGRFPLEELDHENYIRDSNHLSNLSESTRSKNVFGRRTIPRKYPRGVCYRPNTNKKNPYTAQITHLGQHQNLGYFPTAEAASAAYLERASKLFGGSHR